MNNFELNTISINDVIHSLIEYDRNQMYEGMFDHMLTFASELTGISEDTLLAEMDKRRLSLHTGDKVQKLSIPKEEQTMSNQTNNPPRDAGEWILTDPDCLQMRRQFDVGCEGIFELMQVDTLHLDDKTIYELATAEIDLNEYDQKEIDSTLSSYGYDSMKELEEAAGGRVEGYAQLAEMLFETYANEFYDKQFDSWNKALAEVERRTGADLSGLKEVEKPSLSQQIEAASARAATNNLSKENSKDLDKSQPVL